MVAYGRFKTKENFKLLALKVVALTIKRFQIYRFDLETFGILENWSLRRGDCLREVVATRVWTVVYVTFEIFVYLFTVAPISTFNSAKYI